MRGRVPTRCRMLPEPVVASEIAALTVHDVPGETVAIVITGADAPTGLFDQVPTTGAS